MNPFDIPQSFEEQREWASTFSIHQPDAAYTSLRKRMVRMTLFNGLAQAFVDLPDLEKVEFIFDFNRPSLKDSMVPLGSDDMDPAVLKKLTAKFQKFMGAVRSRVGQDRNTWEGFAQQFNTTSPPVLERHMMEHVLVAVFDDAFKSWNNVFVADIQAKHLASNTQNAHSTKRSPRL